MRVLSAVVGYRRSFRLFTAAVAVLLYLVTVQDTSNSQIMDFKKFTSGAGTLFNRAKQVDRTCACVQGQSKT